MAMHFSTDKLFRFMWFIYVGKFLISTLYFHYVCVCMYAKPIYLIYSQIICDLLFDPKSDIKAIIVVIAN